MSSTVSQDPERDLLSALSSKVTEPGQENWPGNEFVVHTSSIPLATSVNKAHLLNKFCSGRTRSLFHGATVTDEGHPCPKRSCMYLHSDSTRHHETIAHNCPCLKVTQDDGSPLKPRCFIMYLRTIGTNLINDPESLITDKRKIVFCYDSWNICSKSYSGPQRDWCKISSWDEVKSTEILHSVLTSTYWYSKRWKDLGLLTEIENQAKAYGFPAAKAAVEQTLFTINGLLVKKFLAFPIELTCYRKIADQTAFLFRDLLKDYGKLARTEEGSCYEECKKFFQFVKAHFHKPDETAGDWLSYDFKGHKSLRSFFQTEIYQLKKKLEATSSIGGKVSYYNSIAWFHRSITMAQTRVMGYLPRYIAEEKRVQYRMNISRPVEQPPVAILQMIRKGLPVELQRSGVPQHLFAAEKGSEDWNLFTEINSAAEIDLKDSASYEHYVRDGGKLEDARLILKEIRDNKLKIPIRDLDTGEIKEYLDETSAEMDAIDSYQRVLFWYAFAHMRNAYNEAYKLKPDYFYTSQGEKIGHPIFHAKIVHISEPGKERNLTKSSGLLSWFLTPGAKVLQRALATAREHRAGLLAAGHEWRHQKRISALSDESNFIYDPSTGKAQSNIYHSFKDWTEATDFIGKMVGMTHLRTFMEYTAFPAYYGRLIQFACVIPQPVSEWIVVQHDTETATAWSGYINEGFMMGNPVTKVILHLIHSSERQVVMAYLERVFKQRLVEPAPFKRTGHERIKIDAELISALEPRLNPY